MTNIIVLEQDGTKKVVSTPAYATKELLQQMKNKTNPLKLSKGNNNPKLLCTINIDNFQLHILGWNAGSNKIVNSQLSDVIVKNKKRVGSLIHGNFYGDLVIIKTTLSTKILPFLQTEYDHLIDRISGNKLKSKQTLKLKAKYGLDEDNNEENEDNEENKDDEDNEDDEDDEDSDNDEDNDEDNDDIKISKKYKDINLDSDDEIEGNNEEDEADDYEDEDLDEMDNLDDDEDVDENYKPININDLNDEVADKKKKTHKQKKEIELTSFGNILSFEKKGSVNKNLHTIRADHIAVLNKIEKSKPICRQLEQGTYNWCVEQSISSDVIPRWDNNVFKSMYTNKIRSIYTNLSKNSYVNNVGFIERFKSKQIDPYQVAYMEPHEIYPEKWEKIREAEYRKNKLLYQTKDVAMTDEYKCRRCKKRETSYFELQIRSADEPATLFITCINCGNRWTRNP